MTATPQPVPTTSHERTPSPSGGPKKRGRNLLRGIGAAALFLLLAFFWWAVVYTFLVAGWWLLEGYAFVAGDAGNGYVWNSRVDWLLMLLALFTLWPIQRPLRTRIVHFMDTMDDPYEVISRLNAEIDGAPTGASTMAAVAALLADTLNVSYVSIEAEHDELGAVHGTPPREIPIALPLRYNDLTMGTLHIAPRMVAGMPMAVDERLLHDLARQVSVTLYAAQVSADLQESRRRIVTAREEGRRQLRRDLHDGLGPALATMTMQADTARELIHDDPHTAEQLLTRLVDQAQATVDEVRRIVHGLRPPALDDMGLYGALEVLTNGFVTPGLHLTLTLPAVRPQLAAATEVAVFRIVQEALTNVSRHAHAHSASVTLAVDGGELLLTVFDDGVGLPPQPDYGLGLHSMRARAEELGGRLTVRPNGPAGCCIHAQLPLEIGGPHGPDSYSDL
jgi:signal transduction histidine kinase